MSFVIPTLTYNNDISMGNTVIQKFVPTDSEKVLTDQIDELLTHLPTETVQTIRNFIDIVFTVCQLMARRTDINMYLKKVLFVLKSEISAEYIDKDLRHWCSSFVTGYRETKFNQACINILPIRYDIPS